MKNQFFLKNGLDIGLVSDLMLTSCQYFDFSEPPFVGKEKENNSVVFPKTETLFGKNNEDWAIRLTKTYIALDCDHIGKGQLLNLSDKVVAPYGNLEEASGEYTITQDQYVFLPPTFNFNYYGCPEGYDWEPAEGQSIEEFLSEFSDENMDAVETLEVFLDGIEVGRMKDYRLNTGLFHFKGNPDLTECYEPCITGETQPGLVANYFLMFKKMKVGKHTIVIKGEMPKHEYSYVINFVLNVID